MERKAGKRYEMLRGADDRRGRRHAQERISILMTSKDSAALSELSHFFYCYPGFRCASPWAYVYRHFVARIHCKPAALDIHAEMHYRWATKILGIFLGKQRIE